MLSNGKKTWCLPFPRSLRVLRPIDPSKRGRALFGIGQRGFGPRSDAETAHFLEPACQENRIRVPSPHSGRTQGDGQERSSGQPLRCDARTHESRCRGRDVDSRRRVHGDRRRHVGNVVGAAQRSPPRAAVGPHASSSSTRRTAPREHHASFRKGFSELLIEGTRGKVTA